MRRRLKMHNPADDVSQKERREILLNDRKVKGTYHSLASASADELAGGRFAQSANRQTVVGASPVSYPRQPSTSPWFHDPCGVEPVLGFSVEDQLPVGEHWELEKSLASAAPDAAKTPTSSSGGDAGDVGVSLRRDGGGSDEPE
jgi:hypothetical protein